MIHKTYEQNREILAELIKQAGLDSQEELTQVAKVSGLQVKRLEYGLIYKLSVENLLKLANALNLSLETLIAKFTETSLATDESSLDRTKSAQSWQQEYQKLAQEMAEQEKTLHSQWQQNSIQTIESWLIQWPTAVAAIAKNPDLPAERLVPLVQPVKDLIEQWGITAINTVGEELPYNPQLHELMSGAVEPGATVKVRYVGYKQEDRILYKAKVSPIAES